MIFINKLGEKMNRIKNDLSISNLLKFSQSIYGKINDRCFSVHDLIDNMNRFAMRSLKGVRKNNPEKTATNLVLSFIWFLALNNRLQIDIVEAIWHHFPGICSYCLGRPCTCSAEKHSERQRVTAISYQKPLLLSEWQKMLEDIYPASGRTAADAGIHLAEEIGELAEAMFIYLGSRNDQNWQQIELEMADIFSNMMGVANSMEIDLSEYLTQMYSEGCHLCHKSPCICSFEDLCSV